MWWLWRTTLIPNVRVQIKFLDIISCWKHKLHSHNSHAWLLTNTLSPEKEWWSQWTILKHSYNFTIYFALKWGWLPKEIMVIDIFYHVHQVIGNSRQTSACIRSRSRRPEQHQVHVPKIIHQTLVIVWHKSCLSDFVIAKFNQSQTSMTESYLKCFTVLHLQVPL